MEKEKAIGIDLGTTYSCVGVWENGRVEIIVNDQGNRTTPSMVAFTAKERLVGDAAKFQISSNPLNTIFDVKRLIGRQFTDSSVQADMKLWPFRVVTQKNDKPMIQVRYKGEKKLFAPEEISSMVLMKMKTLAEQYLGSEVKNAVITVPAYFSDSQRKTTKDAGLFAGLNVMRIINEPTAAAFTYGFGRAKQEKKHILVFDLGGGTFDVSIIVVRICNFEVKAVGGEAHLGGEDFDNRMLAYCVQTFNRKYKTNLSRSAKALRRLRSECERAKRSLSSVVETVIDIDCLYEGHDFFLKIRRAKFEELNLDLFEQCMEVVKKCVEDAKLSKRQIDDIVLVGGSSRIPKVQEMVRDFFDGKELCRGVNPDEAVAYGAALEAAVLSKEDVHIDVMVDVTPLSLGIAVCGGVMHPVVPRNTPLPTRKKTSVTTPHDDQIAVSFQVYEGERPLVADNNLLGKFVLTGIPPAPAGVSSIKVCFQVDEDGILSVSAHDKGSGASNEITITNEGGRLSIHEIDKMVADAEKFHREDEEEREKHVAKNALECYVSNMRKRAMKAKSEGSMDADHHLISTITAVEEWLDDNSSATVVQLHDKLREVELKCLPLFSSKRFRFY
ncbi:heat shock cognate 70 kDa protein 2-like [Cryptomeria japonica]|uniref:heat shock cognate 70 kDa protein 2-like n=1 Tax=Cryptomeria japonica TaxID=3369 RepID=UPI0025AB5FF8|nr:heat shock cognate 70 kDa protein 2-like [Cryptomeria japonica]